MKKIIIAVVSVGLFAAPFAAFADTAVLGAADPNLMTMSWGLTGYQTPNVAAGAVITDQHNYSEVCPMWYPKQALGACQVITSTQYYTDRMNDLARSLISIAGTKTAAEKKFPSFAGWIAIQ